MKNVWLPFLLVVVILAVLLALMPQPLSRQRIFPPTSKASIYCKQTVAPCLSLGNGYQVDCSFNNLPNALSLCKGVDGVSVSFDCNAQSLQQTLQLLQVKVVSVQRFDDLTVVCGFSKVVQGGLVVDGNFVNVQVALRGSAVTVGSPLILGSY